MVVANPEMQKQMEKHLPEGQRGPEMWEWLQKSPEMRKQLAKQISQSPDLMNVMDFQNGSYPDVRSSSHASLLQLLITLIAPHPSTIYSGCQTWWRA